MKAYGTESFGTFWLVSVGVEVLFLQRDFHN